MTSPSQTPPTLRIDFRVTGKLVRHKCGACRRWSATPRFLWQRLARLFNLKKSDAWRITIEGLPGVSVLTFLLGLDCRIRQLADQELLLVCDRCRRLTRRQINAVIFASRARGAD